MPRCTGKPTLGQLATCLALAESNILTLDPASDSEGGLSLELRVLRGPQCVEQGSCRDSSPGEINCRRHKASSCSL